MAGERTANIATALTVEVKEDNLADLSPSALTRLTRPRGMRAPILCVGDGALELWQRFATCGPATREEHWSFHSTLCSPPPDSSELG